MLFQVSEPSVFSKSFACIYRNVPSQPLLRSAIFSILPCFLSGNGTTSCFNPLWQQSSLSNMQRVVDIMRLKSGLVAFFCRSIAFINRKHDILRYFYYLCTRLFTIFNVILCCYLQNLKISTHLTRKHASCLQPARATNYHYTCHERRNAMTYRCFAWD